MWSKQWRLGNQRKSDSWTLLFKMAKVTLIDLGYCKVESFLTFSMTDSSLESWFENRPQVERASLLRYEKSISVMSAILINRVWPTLFDNHVVSYPCWVSALQCHVIEMSTWKVINFIMFWGYRRGYRLTIFLETVYCKYGSSILRSAYLLSMILPAITVYHATNYNWYINDW